MAQLIVRNLEDSVKRQLRRRAEQKGRSMEEEVRDILRSAAFEPEAPANGFGTEIAALFTGKGLQEDIPELRGHTVRPPKFGR
jgi:plasmid stability protein